MNPARIDPHRLDLLRALTSDALGELDGLRSHDPAAVRAMRALRLTRYTLACFWIPALEDVARARRDPVSEQVRRV